MEGSTKQRVLAVASSGGHWVQLRRLAPAFEDHDVAYLTTDAGHRSEVAGPRSYVVNDANRWNKLEVMRCALRILCLLLSDPPTVVVSTGAAPACLAIR